MVVRRRGGYVFFFMLMVFPWLCTYILRFLGPVEFDLVSLEADVFILSFVFVQLFFYTISFMFFSSFKLFGPYSSRLENSVVNVPPRITKVFRRCRNVTFLMSVLYPIVSLYDFWVLKDASLVGIVALREAEHLTGPRNSLFGALVVLLSASTPIAMSLFIVTPFRSFYFRVFVWGVFIVGFSCMFLSGGRNGFFISIVYVFLFILLFVDRVTFGRAVSPFLFKVIVVLGSVAFIFSMKIFIDRFSLADMGPVDMLYHLMSDYNVGILIPDCNEACLTAYSIWVYLVFYMTHAVAYLDQYFVADVTPNLMGVYNFPFVARSFDMLLGFDMLFLRLDDLLLKGVYLTLPGSLYVDFGIYGSLVAAVAIGTLVGYLAVFVHRLCIFNKMLLAFISTTLVFSPFYSVLGIANGISFLFILLIIFILSFRLNIKGA